MEANDIALSEHTGTHVDAPIHTWETGIHIDEIPLGDLIGPAIVINVTQKSFKDSNYKITVQDILGKDHIWYLQHNSNKWSVFTNEIPLMFGHIISYCPCEACH